MSMSNALESAIAKLLFQATAITNLADNAASGPLTNLYVALYTSDPGEAGTATTNETSFTNYARQAVARTSGGWAESSGTITNVGAVTFPECGATGATITHVGIVSTSSGAGVLYLSGALTASRAVSNGSTLSFSAGQISIPFD